jgi:hypothetical protein
MIMNDDDDEYDDECDQEIIPSLIQHRRTSQIFCDICGDAASGRHYGSYLYIYKWCKYYLQERLLVTVAKVCNYQICKFDCTLSMENLHIQMRFVRNHHLTFVGFFRRTVRRRHNYECRFERKCTIDRRLWLFFLHLLLFCDCRYTRRMPILSIYAMHQCWNESRRFVSICIFKYFYPGCVTKICKFLSNMLIQYHRFCFGIKALMF